VEDHEIQIHASRFTATDSGLIPTGELRSVSGTPLDLRSPIRLGDGLARTESCEAMRFGGGYDHNFMVDGVGYREAVSLYAPSTGITMKTWTDQPSVQLYTGNMLSSDWAGKSNRKYSKRDGLCLETQIPPDAINHPEFPSPILRAGERYTTCTAYNILCEAT